MERGVTPKELNISFLKERQIRIKKYVDTWKGRLGESLKASEGAIKQNWEGSKGEFLIALGDWEKKSHELVRDFSRRYNGALVK